MLEARRRAGQISRIRNLRQPDAGTLHNLLKIVHRIMRRLVFSVFSRMSQWITKVKSVFVFVYFQVRDTRHTVRVVWKNLWIKQCEPLVFAKLQDAGRGWYVGRNHWRIKSWLFGGKQGGKRVAWGGGGGQLGGGLQLKRDGWCKIPPCGDMWIVSCISARNETCMKIFYAIMSVEGLFSFVNFQQGYYSRVSVFSRRNMSISEVFCEKMWT